MNVYVVYKGEYEPEEEKVFATEELAQNYCDEWNNAIHNSVENRWYNIEIVCNTPDNEKYITVFTEIKNDKVEAIELSSGDIRLKDDVFYTEGEYGGLYVTFSLKINHRLADELREAATTKALELYDEYRKGHKDGTKV